MTLRNRLLMLVLAVLIPALLSAGLAIAYTFNEGQKVQRASMREAAKALALVLERELERREWMLQMLGSSIPLQESDLRTFHQRIVPLAKEAGVVLALTDLNENALLSTRRPFDSPAAPLPAEVLAQRKEIGITATLLTNAYPSPQDGSPNFAVEVPIIINGEVKYLLGMGASIKQLQALLETQPMPEQWRAGIVDGNGVLLARNQDPERFVGSKMRLLNKSAIPKSGVEFKQTKDIDGLDTVLFISNVKQSGWTVYVSVPESVFRGPAEQTAVGMGLVAFVLIAIALGAVVAISRRTLTAVEATLLAAERLGKGHRLTRSKINIRELDAIDAALVQASEKLHGAREEQERRIREAVEAAEHAQSALLQSQKMEALGRLTGGIAHDFNNVFQTMVTGLDLIEHYASAAPAQRAVDSCRRALIRAGELTRRLAVFGRQQEGRVEVVYPSVQLTELQALLSSAIRSNMELEMDVSSDLWPIKIDPTQLELALLNLTMNASDATDGQGRVKIQSRNLHLAAPPNRLASGQYVCISVEDDGKGMSAEVLERALDPFFTTKSMPQSSGMGLPQAYGFARQSGGTLTLSSDPGKGTEVVIYIPRYIGPMPEREDEEEAASAAAVERAKGIKVLLVEDDPLVRNVVQPALEQHGFVVTVTMNAAQALDHLRRKNNIDVVFSDVVMPGAMTGVDLANEIKRHHPKVAVVLASGYSEREVSIDGVRMLSKPYTIDQVMEALLSAAERTET